DASQSRSTLGIRSSTVRLSLIFTCSSSGGRRHCSVKALSSRRWAGSDSTVPTKREARLQVWPEIRVRPRVAGVFPVAMTLTWLDPANLDRRDVDGAVAVLEASRELEAPHEPQLTPNWLRANLNHGWDGDPPEAAVYRESGRVIAVLKTWMPKWDNRHFAEVNVTVDPECRRRGLGRELFEIGLRKVRDAGRTVVYSDCATGTAGEPFLEAMGLTKASEYANRGQDLLTLDLAQLEKGLA